jgi:hypothetical protein
LFFLVKLCQKGLKNVNVKITMFIFTFKPRFQMMTIIVGYKAQSTPFFHEALSWISSSHHSLNFGFFFNCDLLHLSCLLSHILLEAIQVQMLVSKFNLSFVERPDRKKKLKKNILRLQFKNLTNISLMLEDYFTKII